MPLSFSIIAVLLHNKLGITRLSGLVISLKIETKQNLAGCGCLRCQQNFEFRYVFDSLRCYKMFLTK